MNQRVDSTLADEIDAEVKKLASDPSPANRYQMANLMSYTINELQIQKPNLLDKIADVKRSAAGVKPAFKVNLGEVHAYVQAKGATTARSIVGSRNFMLDTVEVSARPVVNMVELANGSVKMSDLIREAHEKMEAAHYHLVQKVISDSVTTWKTPFYGNGTGIVKATLDEMINFWRRTGNVALLGDIEMAAQLSELTGFKASAETQQFNNELIKEFNDKGYIGKYMGCDVLAMTNPYLNETDTTPVFDTNKLYILPAAASVDMRPLKVLFEGNVMSNDLMNIDNGCYEVCLRQWVGAGMAFGNRQYMSVYESI